MQIYEYLFAGLVIILILTASTIMVTTIATPTNNAADKNQLSVTAQKVMTQMLLDAGYPNDWGTTGVEPRVFGLAKCGEISRQAYELDPDKVLRLDSRMPDYLPPSRTVELLNLANTQGAAEYGFTLQFSETMHVSAPVQVGGVDNYTITVTSQYALPISGAEVAATLYYIDNTHTAIINHTQTLHGKTGYDGAYTAGFDTSITTAKILAVTVDYYGAQLTKFYPLSSGATATLYQNRLVPETNQSYSIGSGSDAREILLCNNNGTYTTKDIAAINAGSATNFVVNGTLEPQAVAVIAITGTTQNQLLLASRDFSNINYQTINIQQAAPSGTYAYSMERTVVIGGSVYTATLYLWRMTT
ncbi:MAG TPA: hypothetical protein V6C97_03250 [Oculatellaceae cyanobacterium]